MSNQKKVSPDPSTEILLASMRRITVVTGIPEPVERLAPPLLREMVTTESQGVAIPSSTIQRAWHRIGNRIRKAIQPVPNAYEDAAQTIGGRIPTAISPTGFTRKARPPATHSQFCPAEVRLSRDIYGVRHALL